MSHPIITRKAFFRAIGYEPHPGQVQIHGAVDKARTVVVACGSRFGKTWAAAAEMAYQSILPRDDFIGWAVAPTHVLADIVFDKVFQILSEFFKGKLTTASPSTGEIEFVNLGGGRSRIMRRSTDQAGGKAKLAGYPVDFMVIDEASGILDDSVWENQLRTRLVDRSGTVLMISTPRGTWGFFAALYRSALNDPMVVAIRLPTWVNPYVPKGNIQREREKMLPRDFAQEYAAEFVATSGQVFSGPRLERACVGEWEKPRDDAEYFAGLDWAIKNDHTVLTILRAATKDEPEGKVRVVWQDRFLRAPIEAQIDRIKATLLAYGNPSFLFDETGVGAAIAQQMSGAGLYGRGIVWTAGNKMNMVKNTMRLVEGNRIVLPNPQIAPTLWDEMNLYEWQETPSRLLTAAAPAGATDDCVASLIMACWWIKPWGGEPLVLHAGSAGEEAIRARQARATDEDEPADRRFTVEGLADPLHPSNEANSIWTSSGKGGNGLFRNGLFDHD